MKKRASGVQTKEWFKDRIEEYFPQIKPNIVDEEIAHRFIGRYQEKKWGIGDYNVVAVGLFVVTNKNIYFYGKVKGKLAHDISFFAPDGSSLKDHLKVREINKQVLTLPIEKIVEIEQKKNKFTLKLDISHLGPKFEGKTKKILVGIPRGKDIKLKETKQEVYKRADEFREYLESTLSSMKNE